MDMINTNLQQCACCGIDLAEELKSKNIYCLRSGNSTALICKWCVPDEINCVICSKKVNCKVNIYNGSDYCKYCVQLDHIHKGVNDHYACCSNNHLKNVRKALRKDNNNIIFKCNNCGKGDNIKLKCSRCRNCYYCDRNCQLENWKLHKKVCIQYIK